MSQFDQMRRKTIDLARRPEASAATSVSCRTYARSRAHSPNQRCLRARQDSAHRMTGSFSCCNSGKVIHAGARSQTTMRLITPCTIAAQHAGTTIRLPSNIPFLFLFPVQHTSDIRCFSLLRSEAYDHLSTSTHHEEDDLLK